MSRAIATTEQALSVIEGRWVDFIGRVATGVLIADALAASKLSKPIFEGLRRTSKIHRQQYEDAKTAYMQTLWDDDTLDAVLSAIAGGMVVAKACEMHGRDQRQLHTIATRDPVIYERYMEAMKIKSLSMAEEVVEIADDTSDDLQMDGKGNNAAVKRSQLRVETRERLMGAWMPRVFGKDAARAAVNVSVTVNHAERLQEARARRDRGVTLDMRPEAQPVIEADIEPMPVKQTIDYAEVVRHAEVPEWLA